MQVLVNQISGMVNRRVVDKTGLTGLYDFELQFSMRGQMPLTTQAPAGEGTAPTAPNAKPVRTRLLPCRDNVSYPVGTASPTL